MIATLATASSSQLSIGDKLAGTAASTVNPPSTYATKPLAMLFAKDPEPVPAGTHQLDFDDATSEAEDRSATRIAKLTSGADAATDGPATAEVTSTATAPAAVASTAATGDAAATSAVAATATDDAVDAAAAGDEAATTVTDEATATTATAAATAATRTALAPSASTSLLQSSQALTTFQAPVGDDLPSVPTDNSWFAIIAGLLAVVALPAAITLVALKIIAKSRKRSRMSLQSARLTQSDPDDAEADRRLLYGTWGPPPQAKATQSLPPEALIQA